MLKDYIKIAIRNLIKHKTTSMINIFSLAVGMCAFILIALYVHYEKNWDTLNKNFQSIYRIEKIAHFPNSDVRWVNTQFPLGPALVKNFPEIKTITRVRNSWGQFISFGKEKTFYETDGYFVDNTLFEVFTIPVLKGSQESALMNPNSIVLTENLANKLFLDQNPIGQAIRLENKYDCFVSAVIQNPPENSHIQYNYFLPISAFKTMRWDAFNKWDDHFLYTYALLQKNVTAKNVTEKIAKFDHQFEIDNKDHELYLKPLSELHLNPDHETNLSIIIYLFSAIGLFALALGCINYMNLSTACAINRAKEIGIKKTIGANKHLLMKQFLCESTLFSIIAFIIAITLAELSLPLFNIIVNRPLSLELSTHWKFICSMLFINIFVGITSGFYPAFYLSSLSPLMSLKQNTVSRKNKYLFRKELVVFQFFISILLMVATMVVYNQIDYMKKKDLGFNQKNILLINTKKYGEMSLLKYNAFKNELLKNPTILQTTFSNTIPFYSHNNTTINWEGAGPDEKCWLEYNKVHHDFIDTYKMDIKEGRDFQAELSASDKNSCILNETAVKCIGWEKPLGKTIYFWGRQLKVIGIVRDFHFNSLHNELRPYLMISAQEEGVDKIFSIRIADNLPSQQKIVQSIINTFQKFYPNELYIHQFLTDTLDYETFDILNGVTKTFGFFSMLAIIIASFGLFGLVSYSVQEKTKEIGLRKVLGASVFQVLKLLLINFLKLFLIANLIAWPLDYFILNQLLQEFAYRTSIELSVFILAGSLGFVILMGTVYLKVVKAATINPVEALRYE